MHTFILVHVKQMLVNFKKKDKNEKLFAAEDKKKKKCWKTKEIKIRKNKREIMKKDDELRSLINKR